MILRGDNLDNLAYHSVDKLDNLTYHQVDNFDKHAYRQAAKLDKLDNQPPQSQHRLKCGPRSWRTKLDTTAQ